MSQNIAILLGNTKYDGLQQLECCANDVHQMRELLLATEKFSQIIDYVDKPVNLVKDKIRELAESNEAVEEIFLYFSGHGLSNSDDFFMCFSGFKESSPNTTGLSRNDAFELVRLFKAKLSVIVIDACEAGRNLIKNPAHPIFNKPKTDFSDFIQISSCIESQNSLADDRISLFTDEFIKACLNKESGPIYYNDVESALRDSFLSHPSQTPHFIRQSSSQEKFCADATLMKGFKERFLVVPSSDHQAMETPTTDLDIAKKAIEGIELLIPSMPIAQKFIQDVFKHVLSNAKETPEVADFFDVRTVNHDDFERVHNKRSVTELLERRGGTDVFVESDVQRKRRNQPLGIINAAGAAIEALMTEDEYDTKYEIWNHSKLQSVHVGIYFDPKYKALNRIFSEIVFLPRLTECLILTCNSYERRSGWDSFSEFYGKKEWEWSHHSWLDDPSDVVDAYVSDPYEFAKKYIISFRKDKARSTADKDSLTGYQN